MRSISRLSTALCVGTLLTGLAHAQLSGFYPLGADSLSLNNEDFRMMIDAANDLLRRTPLRTGATTSWRNSQTGSKGTISVTKTFHHNAMPCHTLVYETIPARTPPANRTTLNWCSTSGGEWKILS
jgi:hypothetical protein